VFRFRRAVLSDCETLTALAHAAKRHWRYDESLIELWRPTLTVPPDDLETDVVWCAEFDGKTAAFYSISDSGGAWELDHMWVLPELIGKGLGRAMFDHMMGELRARGAETLRIESDPNAVGFYERMGARRIGDVPAIPKGRTLPLLELTITASK
jgi:GNAT superfamily N-acetyltransferase